MTVAQLTARLKLLPDQNAEVAIQVDEGEPALIGDVIGYPQYHNFPYVFIVGDINRRPS